MNCKYISFEEAAVFSHNDTSYATLDPKLREFYAHSPTLESFPNVIENRKKYPFYRDTLYTVLREQYEELEASTAVSSNLELLKLDNTFTITTAHQPSLFTGPLYYIYKIVSVINLCEKLQATYPSYNFIPVFWMGGEDHDFEEINHVKIFRDTLVWENDETGSVGKMSNKHIQRLLEQLQAILGDSLPAQDIMKKLRLSFNNSNSYGKNAIQLTHQLFKNKGLIIIDSSLREFKQKGISIFKKELLERQSESLVQSTQNRLVKKGFKAQAFPRAINLFYLGETGNYRERIDFSEGRYQVLNQDISFSEEEILQDLECFPERYSPNVVMRPLYQELLLPNLAYIGGGGELAYWLERKEQFDYFTLPYPMLIRRDSVLWIDKQSKKKMDKLEITEFEIWKEEELLISKYVKKIINEEKYITDEIKEIQGIYQQLIEKIRLIDPSLAKATQAEMTKTNNGLNNLQGKIIRSEKRKNETAVNQIRGLKEKLFPSGSLQERKDNFIPFYMKYGEEFFETLYDSLDPLDRRVKIIIEK